MRKLIEDKRGKTSPWLVVGVIAVLIVAVFLVYSQVSQKAVVKDIVEGASIGGCEVEPYIDNSTFNTYLKGTSVGVTNSYVLVERDGKKIQEADQQALGLTGGSSGTAFQIGDKIKIFSSASGYIDTYSDKEFEITKCGANSFTNYISQGDAITLDILTYPSKSQATDGATGGAVNLSDGGTANDLNFYVTIEGAKDKDTGQVLLTLELNDSEVDTLSIKADSANAEVINDDPNAYTGLALFVSEGTSPSKKFTFVVDNVDDGGIDTYLITATPDSGVTMGSGTSSGFVYVNSYAAQYFIDDDGSIQFGWETSDAKTLKYEQVSADHDALIS